MELQQQFNALVSRYQQIYGGALVELDGKQLTIPQLGPYKEDLDPAVRRAAYEAEAGYFDAHRAELDEGCTRRDREEPECTGPGDGLSRLQ